MSSNAYADREAIFAALAQAETAHRVLASASLDALSSEEILEVLARREALAWRAPAADHRLLARLVADGNPGVLGAANLTLVLEERLRISRGVARRRLAEAADLGPRTAVDGQPLEPVMPSVAQGVADGVIGPEQVAIVRDTYAKIPAAVDPETRADAEKELAELATQYGPSHLSKLATMLLMVLDPDGDFADRRRAAARGLSVGAQTHDGMRNLRARLTPEAWATLEPILEKLAAPGMCNPADEHPCVSGTPSEEQIQGDRRTIAQRNHDALVAAMRALLASGDLGQHNGLPVTVIVTTTLAELNAAAHGGVRADLGGAAVTDPVVTIAGPGAPSGGPVTPAVREAGEDPTATDPAGLPTPDVPAALTGWAVTAGGSMVPMSDFLRMASHALHYLVIFDGRGRPLWLGRTKRLASADQRLVLFARDKGCTKPGCTRSAYRCQAHHLTPYGRGREGRTDIDDLGLACGGDNTMADTQNWTTSTPTDASNGPHQHTWITASRGSTRITNPPTCSPTSTNGSDTNTHPGRTHPKAQKARAANNGPPGQDPSEFPARRGTDLVRTSRRRSQIPVRTPRRLHRRSSGMNQRGGGRKTRRAEPQLTGPGISVTWAVRGVPL